MRIKINLKCTGCGQQNYMSSKNKATHPEKVKVLKYCPKERKVIMLKVFEEWTIREIADCLHENPNTVKSMLYRGLKKLRGKVEAEMV